MGRRSDESRSDGWWGEGLHHPEFRRGWESCPRIMNMCMWRQKSALLGMIAGAGLCALLINPPSSVRGWAACRAGAAEAEPPAKAEGANRPAASDEPQTWGNPHPVPVPSASPLAQYDPGSREVHPGWDPGDAYLRGYEDVIPLKTVAVAKNR